MIRTMHKVWGLVVIVAVMFTLGSASIAAQSGTPATPAAPTVVRDVLSHGDPAAAPGDDLELVRYTIPLNIELPIHRHPGMQVSTIVSGTLRYTVLEGEMTVHRANGRTETVTPASGEVEFHAGDAIVEPAGMIHKARNTGTEPIVILTASLFEADAPPAELVTPEATPAT